MDYEIPYTYLSEIMMILGCRGRAGAFVVVYVGMVGVLKGF